MRVFPWVVCSLLAVSSTAFATARDVGAALSKVQGGGRGIHRKGAAYAGIMVVPANGVEQRLAPAGQREIPVVVRFSRALGFSKDARGMAVQIPHPGQGTEDLLMVTSKGQGRVGRRLISMTPSFIAPYSSILGHTVNNAQRVVMARPDAHIALGGEDFAELDEVVARGDGRFTLETPSVYGGHGFNPLGGIQLTRKLSAGESDALKFYPWNNRILIPPHIPGREGIYDGSQSTR